MDTSKFKILIDEPAKELALGYDVYAKSLAEIIKESNPQFAIGIFGGWGTGKTTLMQKIQSMLMNEENIICVDFCAWRYEKEEHLLIPLLASIMDSINTWKEKQNEVSIEREASNLVETISLILTSLAASISLKVGLPSVFELSVDASKALEKGITLAQMRKCEKKEDELSSVYYICFKSLKEAFESFNTNIPNKRIVIFIDDLDRCLPKNVIQMLESMKLFFDLPGFIFVVGLDQEVAEWCIDINYKNVSKDTDVRNYQIRGFDYLKKIFQVPFTILPAFLPAFETELESLINLIIIENKIEEEQAKDIIKKVLPHIKYIIRESGINPREIKRFINAYTLNLKIEPQLKPEAILALKTIEFNPEWNSVLRMLKTFGSYFLNAFDETRQQDEYFRDYLIRQENIPGSFQDFLSNEGKSLFEVAHLDKYIRSGLISSMTSNYERSVITCLQKLANCHNKIRTKPIGTDNDYINIRQELKSNITFAYKDLSELGFLGSKEIKNASIQLMQKVEELGPKVQRTSTEDQRENAWDKWSNENWKDWQDKTFKLLENLMKLITRINKTGNLKENKNNL